MIDYQKYLRIQSVQSQRVVRQRQDPVANAPLQPLSLNKSQCLESGNEFYQECGTKCVLGCRYSALPTILPDKQEDCEQNQCFKGCFCKEGFVRDGNRCILASECPSKPLGRKFFGGGSSQPVIIYGGGYGGNGYGGNGYGGGGNSGGGNNGGGNSGGGNSGGGYGGSGHGGYGGGPGHGGNVNVSSLLESENGQHFQK